MAGGFGIGIHFCSILLLSSSAQCELFIHFEVDLAHLLFLSTLQLSISFLLQGLSASIPIAFQLLFAVSKFFIFISAPTVLSFSFLPQQLLPPKPAKTIEVVIIQFSHYEALAQ